MQNQTIRVNPQFDLSLPGTFQTYRFDFVVSQTSEKCALHLRDGEMPYFDLSMWQREIITDKKGFEVLDTHRFLPPIAANGTFHSSHHGNTLVVSNVSVLYSGHLIVWAMVIIATILFGVFVGNLIGLGVMLIINLGIALAFHSTNKRREKLIDYIYESLCL